MGIENGNITIAAIDRDIQIEISTRRFWDKFTGVASRTSALAKGEDIWNLSGSPINVVNRFKETARNKMVLPVLGTLYNRGTQGRESLEGKEEETSWYWQAIYVHLKRSGMKFPDLVQQNYINWAATVDQYKPLLVEWWANWLDMDITLAYLEGFSDHITIPEANGGLGLDKKYNPNFKCYDADNRNFSYTPTVSFVEATYKTNIIAAMQDVDSTGTADNSFDHYTLEALKADLPYDTIEGWNIGGEVVYPLIIHSLQERTLRQDQVWINAQVQSGRNKVFSGEIGRWGNIVVLVNDRVARLPYYAGTTLDFFNYNMGEDETLLGRWAKPQRPAAAVGTQNVACALLIGAKSMNQGIYANLTFMPKDTRDYGMVEALGGMMFYGNARNDSYDEIIGSASPTVQLPCQSLIVTTQVSY